MKHILTFLLFIACYGLAAKELPLAKPEDVGMSSAKLAKVDEVLKGFVAERKLAGGIVAIA